MVSDDDIGREIEVTALALSSNCLGSSEQPSRRPVTVCTYAWQLQYQPAVGRRGSQGGVDGFITQPYSETREVHG